MPSNLTRRGKNLYFVCLLFPFIISEINFIVLPENIVWWQVENNNKSSFITNSREALPCVNVDRLLVRPE